jgi:hypothetical protein
MRLTLIPSGKMRCAKYFRERNETYPDALREDEVAKVHAELSAPDRQPLHAAHL